MDMENDKYFQPFGHLKGTEKGNPIFKKRVKAKNKVVVDFEGENWQILKEHRWKRLNCPISDQSREDVECRHIALCDVITTKKQVNKDISSHYFGGIVGDKISAAHLFRICDRQSGIGLCSFLRNNALTTRIEYRLKCEANSSTSSTDPYNMTGCTAHTIKGHEIFEGDYGMVMSEQYKNEKFKALCEQLEAGPFYGSIFSISEKIELIGEKLSYYNRLANDQLEDELHAVMVVGYGECKHVETGVKDDYWVIQNTWGNESTKYGRVSNKLLNYGLVVHV